MMSSASARRARPRTSQFEPTELVKAWERFAQLRTVRWSWSGDSYMCGTRAKVADQEALLRHHDALLPLAQLAPTGFPSFPQLKSALLALNDKHHILGVDRKFAHRAASLAAEGWRVMCKHLYNLAADKVKVTSQQLGALVGMIQLPDSDQQEAVDQEPGALDADAVRALFSSPGDAEDDAHSVASLSPGDVDICSARCSCPVCTGRVAIKIDDDMPHTPGIEERENPTPTKHYVEFCFSSQLLFEFQ